MSDRLDCLDDPDVCVRSQRAVAVYLNDFGELVIRPQNWPEDDSIIVILPENAEALANARQLVSVSKDATAAERQRRYRERKRQAGTAATVTPLRRNERDDSTFGGRMMVAAHFAANSTCPGLMPTEVKSAREMAEAARLRSQAASVCKYRLEGDAKFLADTLCARNVPARHLCAPPIDGSARPPGNHRPIRSSYEKGDGKRVRSPQPCRTRGEGSPNNAFRAARLRTGARSQDEGD